MNDTYKVSNECDAVFKSLKYLLESFIMKGDTLPVVHLMKMQKKLWHFFNAFKTFELSFANTTTMYDKYMEMQLEFTSTLVEQFKLIACLKQVMNITFIDNERAAYVTVKNILVDNELPVDSKLYINCGLSLYDMRREIVEWLSSSEISFVEVCDTATMIMEDSWDLVYAAMVMASNQKALVMPRGFPAQSSSLTTKTIHKLMERLK